MTRFDERDREAAVARYTKRYRKFGYSPKSLGWFSGRQEIRFDVLTSQYDFRGRHVLDVGCGFGDLVVPLLRRWPTARYTGVDFNPHFVEEACRRHGGPVTHFHLGEFLDWSPPETPDYVVGSGLFNHRYEHADNHQVIEAFVVKALTTARDGLAFDFSSAGRPGERPDAFSVEPGRILQMVRRHTRRVTLRHDYMPWEFAVFAWRDDDGDADENNFHHHKVLHGRGAGIP
ncbi:MAG: class I SAM-dependent methyltransferase [Polyangiaceae bacterium]|nr:class I SAM-dependent methyltransferase [Polyangiaceae bacterium]